MLKYSFLRCHHVIIILSHGGLGASHAFYIFFHLSNNRAMLQVLQGRGHPLESVFASGFSALSWLLVGGQSQPSCLELSPRDPQLLVF